MHYRFPSLQHIDEVKAVVENVDGFIIAERDWGTVVNYVQMGNQTFPEVKSVDDAIRRECRGLIFNKEGRLTSRPYHKFFNAGERTETLLENIDLSKPHVILDKLDGSMIRPIPISDAYRLGTKMGITDVAMQAEVWLVDRPNYDKFIRECIFNECTPIFEWCSRKQRIVIDYPEDRLVLTALRNNYSGEYLDFYALQSYANAYKLDLVKEYPGSVDSMESLLEETRDLKGQEGWIIRFNDGHMLKLKGQEYVTIHKAKDHILREWGVIELILDEKSDDIKPFLIDSDRMKLEEYETEFWAGVQDTAAKWAMSYYDTKQLFGSDRKGFALDWAPRFDQSLRGAIFKAWDDPKFDFRGYLIETIRKSLSTQAKIDAARHLWGGNATWDYNNE